MLVPEDLKKKTFARGFRGYVAEEVDKFVADLIKEYEYMYLENLELKGTVERVSSKLEYYQQMESTMQSALTVAQETADEVKASSEKKAALLEQETSARCEQQLAKTKAEAAKLHSDAVSQAETLYNQTKSKADNMLQATMLECSRLREEAGSYAENLRHQAELDTEKLKLATDDSCKQKAAAAAAEAGKLLENARNEAARMMLEANTSYRKIVADAEERSRNLIFAADAKAAQSEATYLAMVKKTALHRDNMRHLLENQLNLLKDFDRLDG